MRIENVNSKGRRSVVTEVVEFDSLNEFYDYICKTPFNSAFRWSSHRSVEGKFNFTKTQNFEEAVNYFKYGWESKTKEITQRLSVEENKSEMLTSRKNVLSMNGYQAIVPLYLNGVPNNMISSKMVTVKRKVVTLNKSIAYCGAVDSSVIEEESIKAFRLIKRMEKQGYRINLNLVLGIDYPSRYLVKIRLKSAGEKLNVSKMVFPLVHPSMLRRLFFRFIEVHPTISAGFVGGYGSPMDSSEIRELTPGEYLLPNIIRKNIDVIKSLEDLENL